MESSSVLFARNPGFQGGKAAAASRPFLTYAYYSRGAGGGLFD